MTNIIIVLVLLLFLFGLICFVLINLRPTPEDRKRAYEEQNKIEELEARLTEKTMKLWKLREQNRRKFNQSKKP